MATSFYEDDAYMRITRVFQKLKRTISTRKDQAKQNEEISLSSFGQQRDDRRKLVEYLLTNGRADNSLAPAGILKSYLGRHGTAKKSFIMPTLLLKNKTKEISTKQPESSPDP